MANMQGHLHPKGLCAILLLGGKNVEGVVEGGGEEVEAEESNVFLVLLKLKDLPP